MSVGGGFHHMGGSFDPNGGRVVLDNTTDQTLATTFHDLVLNEGLLGYWKLDEGTGTTAADSSGYGHDAELRNSPSWSSDIPATMDFHDPYTLQFDRSDADYVSIAGTDTIDDAQELTVATWVRLASTPGGDGYTYMRFVQLGNSKAVMRYVNHDGIGKLQFYMRIGGDLHSIVVDHTWATDTWYHVAGTYDGSTMGLYLNGEEQDTYAISGTVGTGSGVVLSHSGNDEALDGLLDDVRIYNRPLSAGEISDLADGMHPRTAIATTSLGADLDVEGDLVLNSGALDVNTDNHVIQVAGDLVRNGGVFTARSGAVTFDGSGTQTLDTDTITLYDLTVNAGSTLVMQRDISVEGTLTNNGTLQQTKDPVGAGAAYLSYGGYGGVLIAELSGTDPGETNVSIKGNQDCDNASEAVRRCFDIAPTITSGLDTTMQFFFADSELSGNDCNTLNAYHWTGSDWEELTLDTSWGGDGRACETEPYSVRVKNVSDFSPFVLQSSEPNTDPVIPAVYLVWLKF